MLINNRAKCKISVCSSLCFVVNKLDLKSLAMGWGGLLSSPSPAGSMNVAALVVVLCLAESSVAVVAPLMLHALLVLDKHGLYGGQSCLLI